MKKADYTDVRYGEHVLQSMDIYLPDQPKYPGFPVIILIHGGGFYCCDKADFHIKPAKYFLEMKFAVVSVNYRMAPEFPYPYPIQDICCVVEWILLNGENYGLDVKKLFLHGTSAGGNLAAIAALKSRRNTIRAVALLCPVIALDTLEEELGQTTQKSEESIREIKKIVGQYVGDNFITAVNVDSYIAKENKNRPPFYLQHGDKDGLIPISQSIHFVQKLKNSGWTEVELDVLPEAEHAGADSVFYGKEAVYRIGDFYKKYLTDNGQ